MLDPTNIPAVESDELLARYIYSSRHFSRESRRVKAAAFLPPGDGKESATRHREATEAELWQVGHAGGAKRGQVTSARARTLRTRCRQSDAA